MCINKLVVFSSYFQFIVIRGKMFYLLFIRMFKSKNIRVEIFTNSVIQYFSQNIKNIILFLFDKIISLLFDRSHVLIYYFR